ncbi:MAG: hypothetical protein E6Q83_10835 [Thiothrix sp.]|nr:MAG: hypothetical protein E6Q83_10835 [Thiothrix sp.]
MPLIRLQAQLQTVLVSFDLPSLAIGNPKAVEAAVQQVTKMFEGYASAAPPQERSYAAALKFLRGDKLSVAEKDWIAAALNQPIKEQGGKCVLESDRFKGLIDHYQRQIDKRQIWRLAWYWLLLSYFSTELSTVAQDVGKKEQNRELLRVFLAPSYKFFSGEKENKILPRWARALASHPHLLSKKPCAPYAQDFLEGNTTVLDQVKADIAIPNQSWFWHELTLALVEHATKNKNDDVFKGSIKKLIEYLEKHSGFKDQAIKLILERYYRCKDSSALDILRDYVVAPDVWKSPKLRDSGIASKWRYVDENIWRMVLAWVTKEHLRLFFEVLSGRHGAQKDRFQFWSQYINQISYTKLVFGSTTQVQRSRNKEIAKLFREEQDIYAILDSNNADLDAFIMQIGGYTFVEFSMNGNAAFIYNNGELPFKMIARRLNDKTYSDGLKCAQSNKIIHNGDWQFNTKNKLMSMGIYPDKNSI